LPFSSSVSSPGTAHSSEDDIRTLIDRLFTEKTPADRAAIVATLTDQCEIGSVAELRELTFSSHWLHVNLAAGVKLRFEHEFQQKPLPAALSAAEQASYFAAQPVLPQPIVFELDDMTDQSNSSGKPPRKKRYVMRCSQRPGRLFFVGYFGLGPEICFRADAVSEIYRRSPLVVEHLRWRKIQTRSLLHRGMFYWRRIGATSWRRPLRNCGASCRNRLV
jgi:hypothetical protein